MKDLRTLKDMKFDKIYLSHSLGLEPKDIVVEADQKISNYIKYRE
jgi:hypothetical protein